MSHAVVIGAGPGLGRALASQFAQNGYELTLAARSEGSLAQIARELSVEGATVHISPLDVTDLEAVDAVVTNASQRAPISLLSYNASMHTGGLLDADPETLRSATDVNAHAAVVAIQAALPDLQQTGGIVLVTGGGIALNPRGEYGVLALGKSALRGAALALADELKPRGVRLKMMTVNGFIRPESRFAPERIAAAFWDFATSEGDEVEKIYTGR